MVRPAVPLEKMHKHLPQVALHGIELGQTYVLDLLDNVCPIDVIHPLPACEAAQQVGLVLRPGEDIAVIEFVGHVWPHSRSTRVAARGRQS